LPSTLVVTGCDAGHYSLVAELLTSLHDAGREGFDIGFVHVGDDDVPPEIASRIDRLVHVRGDAFFENRGEGFRLAYTGVKARLPEYFPGYDTYVWLDGDTWVQNRAGIDQIVHCAQLADLCAHPELDPNYHRMNVPSDRLMHLYGGLYGAEAASRDIRAPQFNSGVFGAKASSPLWRLWSEAQVEANAKVAATPGLYHSDQTPLHHLIASGRLGAYPLRAVNNWLVHAAYPAVNLARKRLTAPTFPFEEINIVHLTWVTKTARFRLGDTGRDISFRYAEIKALFAEPG
jgi:hypothetical protein